MAWYSIYKYTFSKNQQGELFTLDNHSSVFDNAQHYFGSLFTQGTSLVAFKKKKDELVSCPNGILSHRSDIIVMRLCDNRNVSIRQDYKKNPEVTNPFCQIVIDNRPGRALMAIEKESSFGNPDKAAEILEETINNYLRDYRISIEIKQHTRVDEFWSYVDEQTLVNKDPIRKVVFDYPNPKLTKSLFIPKDVETKVNALFTMLGNTNAVKGHLQMEASKEGSLQLKRTKKDMAQMVALCCNNGYNLSVYFKNYGIFRVNDRIKTVKSMDESILNDFIAGVQLTSGSFGLIVWLDDLYNYLKICKNATEIPSPRKRRNT